MSKVLLIFMFVFLLLKLDAQIITENRTEQSHPFYLGVGTGIDNFTGLIGVPSLARICNPCHKYS